MPRAALGHLPLEITHLILGHLGFHSTSNLIPEPPDAYFRGDEQEPDEPSWFSLKLQPLLSLCLVSKRWRDIAQPILYREFTLGYGESWRSEEYTWDGRLVAFMLTVARRRDLAALVKRIYIHPHLFAHVPPLEPPSRITYEIAQGVLREIAEAFRVEGLEQFTPSDLIAVLIMQLPNLQHCGFQLQPEVWEIVPPDALRLAGIETLPLKTLDVSLYDGRYGIELTFGQFTLLHRVSSLLSVSTLLETLNLHMYYAILRADRDPFPSLPNLKTLRLTHSWLSAASLERVLSSCGNLRTFFYEATTKPHWPTFNPFERDYPLDHHFRLPDAARYLQRHRGTLESVHLDLRMREPARGSPEQSSASSFQSFTKLKHLFLNMDEFHTGCMARDVKDDAQLFVTLLPQTLNSLHLSGRIAEDLPRLQESLLGLAESILEMQFPSLEQIHWDANESLSTTLPIRTIFAARDVHFSNTAWSLSKSTLGENQVPGQPSFTYIPEPVGDDFHLLHPSGLFYPGWVPPDLEDPDL
ncbi:hypothetical protein BJY00DRAFT_298899 [Aspergillus carlsbadensis]|nr:hypothetical protein BJY00DRAFT_298899 [Aspergillus carlsbadensis]